MVSLISVDDGRSRRLLSLRLIESWSPILLLAAAGMRYVIATKNVCAKMRLLLSVILVKSNILYTRESRLVRWYHWLLKIRPTRVREMSI